MAEPSRIAIELSKQLRTDTAGLLAKIKGGIGSSTPALAKPKGVPSGYGKSGGGGTTRK